MKLKIEIDNLTSEQAIAIETMLATWEHLSIIGSSRWVSFFVDGDGNFHPKILIDEHKIPQESEFLKIRDCYEEDTQTYFIDQEKIKVI